jgi:hypothetical protein
MQKFLYLVMAALLALPMTTFAAPQEDAMISELQKQIQELSEELEDLNDRVDGAERHAALDRIEFSGDLRARAHSLHYQNVTYNPGINVDFDKFGADAMSGALGPMGPGTALGDMMDKYPDLAAALMSGQLQGVGVFPLAELDTYDINNDINYDSRMRLNMKAKVWDNVKFSGRLSMYKGWGDSTGSQVFDSWRSFTMDGTTSPIRACTSPSVVALPLTGHQLKYARTNCAAAPRPAT